MEFAVYPLAFRLRPCTRRRPEKGEMKNSYDPSDDSAIICPIKSENIGSLKGQGEASMERGRFRLEEESHWAGVLSAAVLFCFFSCGTQVPGPVFAQEKYPSKPVNLLVGYPAGGTTDLSARALALAASKVLGQPVVILNKPGGASSVAVASLKNEKPDGYTIGILPSGAVLGQHMRKVPYDSAKDFTPIMQYAVYLYALVVRADSPWKSCKEFIEFAKASPGKIRYGTGGSGTPQHLVMERLALKEKIKWTHIPFPGVPGGDGFTRRPCRSSPWNQ